MIKHQSLNIVKQMFFISTYFDIHMELRIQDIKQQTQHLFIIYLFHYSSQGLYIFYIILQILYNFHQIINLLHKHVHFYRPLVFKYAKFPRHYFCVLPSMNGYDKIKQYHRSNIVYLVYFYDSLKLLIDNSNHAKLNIVNIVKCGILSSSIGTV